MAAPLNRKTLARYLLLEMALIIAWLEGGMDLLLTAGLLFVYGGLLLLAIGLLIKATWKRHKPALFHAAALMLVTISSALIAAQWLNEKRESSREKAAHLVQQIDAYHRQHGEYPAAMDAAHGFAPADIRNTMGVFTEHNYRYHVIDGGYALSFSEPGFVVSIFDSRTRQWGRSD